MKNKLIAHQQALCLYDPVSKRPALYLESTLREPPLLQALLERPHPALLPILSLSYATPHRVGLFYSGIRSDLSRLYDSMAQDISLHEFYLSFQRVSQALLHLHDLGLAHGALSPEAVVLSEEEEICLLGVSCFETASEQQKHSDLADLASLIQNAHKKLLPKEAFTNGLLKLIQTLRGKQLLSQKHAELLSWKDLIETDCRRKTQSRPEPCDDSLRTLQKLERILEQVQEGGKPRGEEKRSKLRPLEDLLQEQEEQSRRLISRANKLRARIENICSQE